MLFFLNEYFFTTNKVHISPSFFVLPIFSDSFVAEDSPKPLLLYQRRSLLPEPTILAPPTPFPDHFSATTHVPGNTIASIPLRHSTHLHHPPNRFGFTPSLSLTAILSSISISTGYK